ncbi:MAG: FtsX-like permease family protein, partial [Chloroflexi bacterium]|nr:FtsX-like permease family protein [Chloroflexota bacterium]
MVAVPKLHLKLLRDIKSAKIQYGAVAFIIFLGITIFICGYEAYLNLDISYNSYFDRLNMGDYWISVDEIDNRAVRQLNEIPGVAAIGRIRGDVNVDMGGETGEKVAGHVISLPSLHLPDVNLVQIESGGYFSPEFGREILVENHFADYHKIQPGDWLTLEYQGVKAKFRVMGIVVSPEYLWVTKSAQDAMPSPRTFGVFFMPESTAEQIFGMDGKSSELVLRVAPGVDRGKVLDRVKGILRRHDIGRITSKDDPVKVRAREIDIIRGVRTAYMTARKDLPSVQLLRQDLEGFAMLAFLFPLLFLTMASLSIYVLLSRLVESQRIQIGLMRAIGYSRSSILFHYMGFALVVGIAGSLTGVIAGHLLANGLTEMYVSQLNIPSMIVITHWGVIVVGILIGMGIPLVAGLLPAWSTLSIQPAEAMRPAIPASGNRIVMRTLAFLLGPFPYVLKVPLRNIFRNVRRSLFMASGVASAVILILVSMSFVDAVDSTFDMQFNVVQKYDAFVYLQGVGAASTATYIGNLKGVKETEAVLEMPYRVRYGGNTVDTSIAGFPAGSSMYWLVGEDGRRIDVTNDGVLIPISYKERLGAEVGDTVQLEPLVGTVGETEKKLAGYVQTAVGARAFMPLREVQKLQHNLGAATGIFVKFDGLPSADLLKRMYDMPQVASVELVSDTRALIDEMMGFFWVMIGFMLMMGVTLGVAIIFNGVTINVLQRTREMAVMRAIGLGDFALV